MKYGTHVIVTRGGSPPIGTPGCTREVKGIYIGGKGGYSRLVRLIEDDPLATCNYCTKKGDVGSWSPSVVREDNCSIRARVEKQQSSASSAQQRFLVSFHRTNDSVVLLEWME